MSHPPFAHNPHVYGGVDPASRAQAVPEEGDAPDSVVHSDVAGDEEAPATAVYDDTASVPESGVDDDSDPDANVDVNGDGQVSGYEVFTKAELVAHVETLNESRPESDQLPTTGNKPDLVRRIQEAEAQVPAQPGPGE